ncbi:hypothetical protein OG811_26655 [Micromonospora sp. NBC_01638]|nr:hypothetical protein OG811_26655 [Micromonospora sp. NBC_01638]
MTPEKVAYALSLLVEPERSLRSIATLLKISPTTLYKVLPELLTPEQATTRLGKQIDRLPANPRPAPSLTAYDQLLTQRPSRED